MNTGDKEIRIEAKTIEAAVVMACVKLGVTQDNIEYEVVKQPKSGFMSLFGGKAEIKAWARGGRQGAHKERRNERGGRDSHRDGQRDNQKDNQRNASGRHQGNGKDLKAGDRESSPREQGGRDNQRGGRNRNNRPTRNEQPTERKAREYTPREERVPAEPLAPEVLVQLEAEIRTFCKELCEKIVGETVEVTSNMMAERLQLEVDNAAVAQLIQEQSKFIESLEHILRKKPRHLKQDLPFRIFIDSQGSRKGREDEIGRIAREKADHVAESGQKVVLDYKSAVDRKIVHMTLENDQRVYTKSIGTGSGRKLMILPSRGGRKPSSMNDNVEGAEDNSIRE